MMQSLIEGFPLQLQKALDLGAKTSLKKIDKPIQNIVVAGLGGSGIGGNLVLSLIQEELKLPWIVVKGYEIPQFVNENTLFVASSFSGNTEETLTTFAQAENKGAEILCLTSGGKVLATAQEKGYNFLQMPQEAPSPRAFMGYSVGMLLQGLTHLGFISTAITEKLKKTATWLAANQKTIAEKAEELSNTLVNKLPIIYAEERLLPAITRLQQQINENSKQLCHTHILPEMNHNELVGWEGDKDDYQNTVVWMVRHSKEYQRTALRIEICKNIIQNKTPNFVEVTPQGEDWFTEIFYLIHLFDWVSLHLAEKNKVDPFPVEIINYLKEELGKVPM